MPADGNIRPRECIRRYARGLTDFFRHDGRSTEALRRVLQPRGDTDAVAERGEYRVTAKADIADDNFTGVYADSVLDGLAHLVVNW